MNRFFHELQQRGVIRVAGLYGAVVWLLLQASDVLFPAFNIPDSAVKILLAGALIGLPVVLTLAWFYELTDKGIQLEEDVRKTGATRLFSGNQIYFVIITLLAIALSISVYMNFQASEPEATGKPKLLSVLIADFDNQTNDPIFDGSVEEALTIGMEGASFITSYNRNKALDIANKLNQESNLKEARARLVAVREGISLVLSGSISRTDDGYLLKLKAIDPHQGELVTEAEASAEGKLEVLQAVGSLAGQLRESLGDVTISDESLSTAETFSASSLKAMQLYSQAQQQAQKGNHEEAVKLYEQATTEDNEFGRAWSGWALSEFQLGHLEKAEQLWETTLTLLQGMTEREKYRTLGLYYTRVSGNYAKAVENYQALVTQFPGDAIGRSNLAVSHFMMRHFDAALREGKAVVDIYPEETTFRSNYALYAMYASDFKTAREQAEKLIADQPNFVKAYLPLAIANLAEKNFTAAQQAYQQMAALGTRGASLSASGLADIALTEGKFQAAIDILTPAIEKDRANNSNYALGAKYIALAEAQLAMQDKDQAQSSVDAAVEVSKSTAQQVAGALLYVQLGSLYKAGEIADHLIKQLQQESRAYGELIRASLYLQAGNTTGALDLLLSASNKTDMWLVRFELGKVYVAAGAHAEALSEFELCQKRIGETTSLYLDDLPTFHRSVELLYWLGRTQHEMGISGASIDNLKSFLSHAPVNSRDLLVSDAQSRLGTLTSAASAK